MEKTRSIDFAKITLRDALDLAILVEEEAKDRYEEFAHSLKIHRNPTAAGFFEFMLKIEGLHENRLADRRKELFGDQPRTVRREMIFDIEAPEYHEVRAKMTHRQALEVALEAEKKAFAFFDEAVKHVKDPEVLKLFNELRDEEQEHAGLVEKEIAKLPPGSPATPPDDDDDEDGPVAL